MVNNLPGPDKGLIDVLFGNAAPAEAAPQALVPGVPTDAKGGVPEEFKKMLAAQDQPAPVVTTEPKGGQKLISEISGDPKAKVVTQAKAEKPEEAVVPSPKKKTDASTAPEATAAAATAAAAAAAPATQVTVNQPAKEVKQASVDTQGAPGPKQPVQQQKHAAAKVQAQPQASSAQLAGQANAMFAATQLSPKQALAAMQQLQEQQQQQQLNQKQTQAAITQPQSPMVLQPVVIQMPMAVPMAVDVIEVDTLDRNNLGNSVPHEFSDEAPSVLQQRGNDQAAIRPKTLMRSSQEFVTGHNNILGQGRPDPRLMGRAAREQLASDRDSGQSSDMLNLAMPQVAQGSHGFAGASNGPVRTEGVLPMNMTIGGQAEVSSPMVLASQVANLAARGGGTIKMKVMPEALGELTISVQNNGKQLNVKFEASSSEAREALTSSLPELRNALAANRYDVGSIEVDRAQMPRTVFSLGASSGDMSWGGMGGNLSQFGGSDYSQQQQQQGGDSRGGNAWERYQAQHDAREQQLSERQQGGQRRYQQQSLEYGA